MNLQIISLQHVPEIYPGTNLSICLQQAIQASGFELQPTDILATPHYELVGWLPEELQDRERFTWAMGVAAGATDPNAAKALIQFLSSPAAAAVIRKRGMEPAAK